VSVNYRLVSRATFPAQLHDVKAAVRWLRGNGPRLGLPTDRIGIWGASAGAYLGSLLALTAGIEKFDGTVGGHLGQSSAVQAVVHWFGQSDLMRPIFCRLPSRPACWASRTLPTPPTGAAS
jgi:acetyl esterase/lipase